MPLRLSKLSVSAAVCGLSLFMPALTAQNRLPQVILAGAQRTTVQNVMSPRVRVATDLGAAPADTMLLTVTLRFNLTSSQQTALAQLEAGQQNPNSPLFHQWLTPEQYAAEFGLSMSDLAAVTAWLQTQGLTVTGIARSHTFVTVSGTTGTIAKALSTSFRQVSLNGETHLTNVTDPALPSEIAGVVGSITGLDDFKLKPHARPRQVPATLSTQPAFTSSISGSTFLAPADFYTIYNLNPLLTKSINGAGITIGIMGQTDISTADVAAFRSASGLSTSNLPTTKLYGTDPGTSKGDVSEAQLDVEWSGAVAPNASILYVNSTDVLGVSMTQAIDNNVAPILSVSYGNCEAGFGSANIAAFNQLFRQANVQGQTVVGPSGDSGATDCDYQVATATQGLAVDFPASSPYVTGVGGTEFNENGGVYFSTSNSANSGSALSYIPEMVWNDSLAGADLAAGGGGASSYFAKPSFQIGTGVPNDYSRDVPDLSFAASANHDGYLFCAQGFCTNGYRNAQNNLDVVGGTSVSTPAYAGILALLEQQIQSRIGNANPTIYGLANSTYYSTVFHDVTVGSNASPCKAGTPNCPNGGSIGYSATAGYDVASGWGSVDVSQMVADWKLVTPAGVGTTGTNISQTTLTQQSTVAGCTGVPAVSSNLTFSVVVAPGISGVSATPTGSVQFLIDNVVSGSAVALVNGAATFTISTTSLSSGSHVITAVYSGDANYGTSKASASVDSVSGTAQDFLLNASTCTVTIASGGTSSPITYSVSSLNGFAGPVTFVVSSTSSVGAGYSFTVTPVTLTAGGSGSTALTVQAFYNASTTVNPLNGSATAQSSGKGNLAFEMIGSGTSVAGLLLLVLPRRRRSAAWNAFAVALCSAGLLAVSGCSSGQAASSAVSGGGNLNTPAGTYSLIVTAKGIGPTGATLMHNATLTVTIR